MSLPLAGRVGARQDAVSWDEWDGRKRSFAAPEPDGTNEATLAEDLDHGDGMMTILGRHGPSRNCS